jgi:hypothetical protein
MGKLQIRELFRQSQMYVSLLRFSHFCSSVQKNLGLCLLQILPYIVPTKVIIIDTQVHFLYTFPIIKQVLINLYLGWQ